jgi:serine/threonine protein phosphatase PrpC
VTQAALTPADRLLLLASDGVTDVLPDDAMMEVALAALDQVRDADHACAVVLPAVFIDVLFI